MFKCEVNIYHYEYLLHIYIESLLDLAHITKTINFIPNQIRNIIINNIILFIKN